MNIKKALVAMLMMLTVFCLSSIAQDRTVTGKVTNAKDGSPLVAASVLVKGSGVGAQTNADGSFSLKVPANATTLVVSSLNFETKEVTLSGNALTIALSPAIDDLNDVVVIGYGSVRKKDLTGSVVNVSSKDFNKGVISTPEQLIQGKVAGVQITSNNGAPGSGSTIRIRGGASLNASNDPLIVVDGMPIDGGGISGQANALALINPNDIESFSILKDASATAIYGARASNGVIIITTKKGKSGAPKYAFSSQFSVSNVTRKADVFSADEIRDIVKTKGPSYTNLLGTASTDWQDEIYQTALTTDNNISVSGALKKLPYRFSLGNLMQSGILRSDKLNRTTVGVNVSPTLFDNHLTVNINYKLAASKSNFADQGAIGAAAYFDPTKPVYSGEQAYNGYWNWLDATSSNGLRALAPRNPLGILLDRNNESDVTRHIANAVVDYKVHLISDLHVVVNTGMDVAEGKGTNVTNDQAATTFMRFKDAAGVFHGGINNQYRQTRNNSYLNAYLNYTKEIPYLATRVEFTGGYEYQNYLTTNYSFNDQTFNGTVVNSPVFALDKPEYRLSSYLGRMNISVKGKYLFTASLRQDGSSKFNSDNRFAVFPSGAVAWKLKEEGLFKNMKSLTELKLRASYGVTGQQDGIGYYDYISYYNLGSNTAQYQFGNTFTQISRPNGYYFNRKWEQTATTNLALDFGFADNRITGTIEAYRRETSDLLNEVNQPAGTNFSNKIVANVGTMENKGIEFTLNIQPIRNKNTTWDIAFNATYNQNRITKLTISDDPAYAGARFGGISGGTGNTILIHSVGKQRGSFFVYKQVYDANDKPIDGLFADLNRDGNINEQDLYQYKGIDPQMFFGLSSSITHKKWNAGIVMRANIGNYLYNSIAASSGTLRNILNPIGYINNGSRDYLRSGFSGNGSNYYLSDYYVQNASFLRIDNINLGYNVGNVFNKKAALRINATVQNVLTITKYTGLDPEMNGGIDNNFYPRPRTIVLGINLDF